MTDAERLSLALEKLDDIQDLLLGIEGWQQVLTDWTIINLMDLMCELTETLIAMRADCNGD